MAEEFIEDIISDIDKDGGDATPNLGEMAAQELAAQADKSASTEQADSQTNKKDEKAADVSSQKQDGTDVQTTDNSDGGDDSSISVEALATQLGWNKDHEGADAVDAATYILRSKDIQKSMSTHNKDLKNQLNSLKGSVDALKEHNEKVYKADVRRLEGEITELKKQKREAIELADVAKVEELDNQIAEKQKDIDTPIEKEQKQTETTNPEYNEWIKDNQWYLEDDDMAKYADIVAEQYQGAPLNRIYSIVRTKVQEVFPEKFEQVKTIEKSTEAKPTEKPPVGPPNPVESSTHKGSEGTFTKADLTQDQLTIMNQFVKGGIMTEEQYINDIAKMQE